MSDKEDLEYIHQAIICWLESGRYFDDEFFQSHREFAYRVIWYVNNEGKTTKYLYFNERNQKIYVDRDFYEWFQLKTNLVEFNLDRYKEVK